MITTVSHFISGLFSFWKLLPEQFENFLPDANDPELEIIAIEEILLLFFFKVSFMIILDSACLY